MLVQVLMDLFTKGMYDHTYASIPKRGSYKGMKTVRRWIKLDPDNTKYCLKIDIRRFFYTIPHDKLMDKLSRQVKDKRILDLIAELLSVNEIGLPLGFYTSQWFSNWYLQELDHYIKEQLHVKYYIRYMDDMVLFGCSKEELHRVRGCIKEYLETQLGLELKGNWQVFPFSHIDESGVEHGRALDFMGFKFHGNRVTLRRTIMMRASRKAKKISKKSKITTYDARQMLAYLGWIKHTNSYNFYLKYIKPYVDIGQMKKMISRASKLVNSNKKGDQLVCGST